MSSYSSDELYRQVSQQVAQEMAAASAPIERAISGAQADEAGALQAIGNLFGNLQPRVEEGTRFVQQSYDQALQSQQGIYQAANARLAGLRDQRAADAQRMAQMIGGPVAVGEFTGAVDPSQQYYAQSGAGDLLHTLGIAQAGVQEAQAFSGKVFPLLRTEQEAETRNRFARQISDLRGQLGDLQSRSTSTINERFLSRQKEERAYELDKQEMELAKLKSERDWKATLRSLKADEARIALARQESRRAESLLTGKYKGKATQAAIAQASDIKLSQKEQKLKEKEINASIQNMTASQKAEAVRLGLTARELAIREWDMKNSGKLAKQKSNIESRRYAMELVDAALNPGSGKEITQTVTTETDRVTALNNSNGYAIKDPNTGQMHYFVDRKVTTPGASVPRIQDPQRMYELLLGYSIPAKMAESIVEQRLSTPNFQPGKTSYSRQEMQQMPFSQLRGVAIKLGFVPQGKATRAKMINYIRARSGAR